MALALFFIWPQPLDPLHSPALSALAAIVPLVVVVALMGGLRKSGVFSSARLVSAGALGISSCGTCRLRWSFGASYTA